MGKVIGKTYPKKEIKVQTPPAQTPPAQTPPAQTPPAQTTPENKTGGKNDSEE